jgi:hypothetical protein
MTCISYLQEFVTLIINIYAEKQRYTIFAPRFANIGKTGGLQVSAA